MILMWFHNVRFKYNSFCERNLILKDLEIYFEIVDNLFVIFTYKITYKSIIFIKLRMRRSLMITYAQNSNTNFTNLSWTYIWRLL